MIFQGKLKPLKKKIKAIEHLLAVTWYFSQFFKETEQGSR